MSRPGLAGGRLPGTGPQATPSPAVAAGYGVKRLELIFDDCVVTVSRGEAGARTLGDRPQAFWWAASPQHTPDSATAPVLVGQSGSDWLFLELADACGAVVGLRGAEPERSRFAAALANQLVVLPGRPLPRPVVVSVSRALEPELLAFRPFEADGVEQVQEALTALDIGVCVVFATSDDQAELGSLLSARACATRPSAVVVLGDAGPAATWSLEIRGGVGDASG